MVSLIPKNRLMDECEWRALGIKQGANWEHYLIHKPGRIHFVIWKFEKVISILLEPFVLMFRRSLKHRVDTDPSVLSQQNTHFPTTRIPLSATMNSSSNHPLADSTNTKNGLNLRGALRMAVNPYKLINNNYNNEFHGSNFESHCDR